MGFYKEKPINKKHTLVAFVGTPFIFFSLLLVCVLTLACKNEIIVPSTSMGNPTESVFSREKTQNTRLLQAVLGMDVASSLISSINSFASKSTNFENVFEQIGIKSH